jgi:prepilin peptidase CpaA
VPGGPHFTFPTDLVSHIQRVIAVTTMTVVSAAVMTSMVLVAVYTDVRVGKIYNTVTAPCALLGLVLSGINDGMDGVLSSLLGIALGFGVFVFSSMFGRILGGGDIKLLMAIGAIQGPTLLFWTIIYMALIGGVLAVVVAMWRRDFLACLKRLLGGLLMRVFAKVPVDVADTQPKARLPYAIPIALGSLVAFYVVNIHGLR